VPSPRRSSWVSIREVEMCEWDAVADIELGI
jgi:hypothetical protein